MTAAPQPQCATCLHHRSPFNPATPEGVTKPWCVAFPAGIPDGIWRNRVDHRQPIEGDNGIRWTAVEGATFPAHLIH